MAGKGAHKHVMRPASRAMGAPIGGQRRANAIDAVVEHAQRGSRRRQDEVRESDIVRR